MPILVLNVVLVSYSLTQVVVGRETCVPAKIVARLGPGTLMAELVGPGTAFRCVPSYFNPCCYHYSALN